jgi:hypothetical protein
MATSGARTAAGTKIYISDPIAALTSTYDAATFATGTYVEIKEVSDLGQIGVKYNSVKFNPLGNRQTFKRRGSYDNGSINVKGASVPLDAGQIKVNTAVGSDSSYAYKVILQSGTTFYFTAQAMSNELNVGSVDNIMMIDVNLEIDNDLMPSVTIA